MATKMEMAQDMVRKYADENQWAVRKDIDALMECREVDSETVWSGYLADAIFSNEDVAEIEEEAHAALVDFYREQMEDVAEIEEEAHAALVDFYREQMEG